MTFISRRATIPSPEFLSGLLRSLLHRHRLEEKVTDSLLGKHFIEENICAGRQQPDPESS